MYRSTVKKNSLDETKYLSSEEDEINKGHVVVEEEKSSEFVGRPNVCLHCPITFSTKGNLNRHSKSIGYRVDTTPGRPSRGGNKVVRERERHYLNVNLTMKKLATTTPIVRTKRQESQRQKYLDRRRKLHEDKMTELRKVIVKEIETTYDSIISQYTTGSKDFIKRQQQFVDYGIDISKYFDEMFEKLDVVNTSSHRRLVIEILLADLSLLFSHYIKPSYDKTTVLSLLSGSWDGDTLDHSADFEAKLKVYFSTKEGAFARLVSAIKVLKYLHLCFKSNGYDSDIIELIHQPISSLFNNSPL